MNLTPCRMTWHFVSAGAYGAGLRPNARPYAYWGAAHSARRLPSLASLRSSVDLTGITGAGKP